MDLKVRNKLWSINGSSTVEDLNGKPYLRVDGKFLSATTKKFVRDLKGNLLYTVRNQIFYLWMRGAFIDDANGQRICKVKRRFSFTTSFNIIGDQCDIKIDGDFIGWNFSIIENGSVIATVRRKLDWTDCFILSVNDEKDAAFAVALIIAIDNIIDAQRNS